MVFFKIKYNLQSKKGIHIKKLLLTLSCFFTISTMMFPASQLNIRIPITHNDNGTLIQEGFVAGTLVKTPQGYTPIEKLQIGGIVVGYDEHLGYTERMILNIFLQNVESYVCLCINNVFCEIGSHQKFYNHQNNSWVQAEHLKTGDHLIGDLDVRNVKLIKKQIDLYAITVENHTFCITEKDIIVHNFEPISSGCALSAIMTTGAVANPIGATIAGTVMTAVATAAFVYKLWNTCFVKKNKRSNQEKNWPVYHNDSQQKNLQSPINQTPESNGSGCSTPPEDPKDNKEKSGKDEIRFPENESMLKHIFRPSNGHFPVDSLENRKHLLDLVRDKKNFIGICERGHEWYVKILENGKQLWAVVRNNIIRNGGINETPRTFNSTTGLSRLLPGK